MGGVEFMPGEVPSRLSQVIVDLPAAFGGDMGILPSPDEKQFGRDFAATGQRVIAFPFPKGA